LAASSVEIKSMYKTNFKLLFILFSWSKWAIVNRKVVLEKIFAEKTLSAQGQGSSE
jgi:hypothetical protein